MKYWEIIADRLSNAGWSLGWVSVVDCQGLTIWIADAHGYGKRFVVRADEMLTAFLELQRAIQVFIVSNGLISLDEPKRGLQSCSLLPDTSLCWRQT